MSSTVLLLYTAVIVPVQICMWNYDDPCNKFPTLPFDVIVDCFFMVCDQHPELPETSSLKSTVRTESRPPRPCCPNVLACVAQAQPAPRNRIADLRNKSPSFSFTYFSFHVNVCIPISNHRGLRTVQTCSWSACRSSSSEYSKSTGDTSTAPRLLRCATSRPSPASGSTA